jgi:hypothetical protein
MAGQRMGEGGATHTKRAASWMENSPNPDLPPRIFCPNCTLHLHTNSSFIDDSQIVPILLLVLLLDHVAAQDGDRGSSGAEGIFQTGKGVLRIFVQQRGDWHAVRCDRRLRQDVTFKCREHAQFEVVRTPVDVFYALGKLFAYVFEIHREALYVKMT